MSVKRKNFWWMAGFLICVLSPFAAGSQPRLTLDEAVAIALENDPWLTGSVYRQQALAMQGEAAAQLPDPMVSLGVANLPTDSFDVGQEPMTQLKIGISQSFPRGETRQLKKLQLDIMSAQQQNLRRERRASTRMRISTLWLDAYRNRESIRLIEKDRELFEYLVDVAESSYRSATGKTRQQDLVRAQLELTRLEDRLTLLRQRAETNIAHLLEWLPGVSPQGLEFGDQLPPIEVSGPGSADPDAIDKKQLTGVLMSHPLITSLDKKISLSTSGVRLAQQQYKPQWSLNTSYAYRDEDPLGNERSDFFSLGVALDVPLFSTNRQDKQVQAAVANAEAVKTEKILALRSLQARFGSAQSRLQRLNQRRALYRERLLKEIHDQAEASLTAYTNDEGDFAEVVRSRIAELNANIDFLNINVDRLQAIVELHYLLTPPAKDAEKGASL